MRILVIFTGGTIGSSVSNGYISTDVQKRYKLLEMYQSNADKEIDFKLLEPYTMLSENLTGESIARLCTVVKDNLSEEYDGVIITHGTDTLQYSACALGYYLQTVKIPVLLVSSNYVLDDGRANGLVNFIASVSFIEQKAGTGVFVPYRNDDGIVYIHRGTRLLPHRPYSDNLYSIDDQYYAVYDADADEIRKNQKYHASDNKVINVTSLPAKWNSDIMRIFPYPGFQYSNLKMDQNYKYMPKAALLDTYHSGTLCSEEDDLELFLTQADKCGIPVFLTGASSGCVYESVKRWEKHHITVLPAASPIAMYMKLWLMMGQKDLELVMKTPVADDIME